MAGGEKAGEMVSEYAGGRTIGATTGTLTPPPPIPLPADTLCALKALSPPPLEPELGPVVACIEVEVEVEEGFAFFALESNALAEEKASRPEISGSTVKSTGGIPVKKNVHEFNFHFYTCTEIC